MKKHNPETKRNPYATNRGGKVGSPLTDRKSEPRATVTRGDDLRK